MRRPATMKPKRAQQQGATRGSATVSAGTIRDELSLITRDAATRTEARSALLAASDSRRRALDVLCAHGAAESTDDGSPMATLSGFARRVLASGRTICEPLAGGNGQPPAPDAQAAGTYAIGAPVQTPGSASSVLCVEFPAPPPNPTTTIWVVESYARLAALCLYDADALDGLLAAGRTDALTGCLNHNAICAELERETQRAARHQRNLSCCFVDLDHFKLVNDRHGHPEGSRVLAEVGAILRAGVRTSDTVGRYGGDEFIILLPDTSCGSARALAERLRSLIRSAHLTGGGELLDVSVGVAQWETGTTAAELVTAADDALRAAKLAGGSTVLTATPA